MTSRSRKEELEYKHYQANKTSIGCDFCAIKDKKSPQFILEKDSFRVIRSQFPYSMWDRQRVTDHLMVIPVEHVASLTELSPNVLKNYGKVIAEYESQGYNIYARAPQSANKSVVHQHTHLILTSGSLKNYVIYFARPFFRWTR